MKAKVSAFWRLRIGVGVGIVTAAAFGVGSVAAQTGYGGGQSSAYRARSNGNSSSSSGATYALSAVVAKMSSAVGMPILADRAVANDAVTAPTATTTAANVDEQIKTLVAQLPKGTVSGKFYLPASAKGGAYSAEAVEAFAMAEARLFGPVGGANTQASGAVEVLGQTLSASKASAVVSDLNLQPVYLIGNPNASASGGQSSYAQNGNYNNSTGANNAASVSQQTQTLLGMSATERSQALTQMVNQSQQNQQVINQVMQAMSATERQQLMQSMGGGGFGGGRGGFGGGRGGFGGGPGRPR